MIKSHNLYKLFTKEDSTHLHKTLGLICLVNYAYRYYMIITTRTMGLHTPVAYYLVGVHGLLSCSSMIFHIPNKRIKGGPMIYPEYRLHSIIFALRSVVCYYLTFHQFPKTYHIGVCIGTMWLADVISRTFPSDTTTMRQMPFDEQITVAERNKIIEMQSVHQMGATLYMLGNEDACFSPMFAIQFAALLMTLVRKSIITTNTWHILYNFSLGTNVLCYWSNSLHYVVLQLILTQIFFYWRFCSSTRGGGWLGNKYIGWMVVFTIFYYNHQPDGTIVSSQQHADYWRAVIFILYAIYQYYVNRCLFSNRPAINNKD